MIVDVWIGLVIVLLTCLRRLYYKGSSLCYISCINFSITLIFYYTSLSGFEYYIHNIARGCVISTLLGIACASDQDNLKLYFFFWVLLISTMLLDFIKAYGMIDNSYYLMLGRVSTIMELILINKGFYYVRGTGHLGGISRGHAFFSQWSGRILHLGIYKVSEGSSRDSRGGT